MFNAHFSGALVGLTWGLLWIVAAVVVMVLRSRERARLYDLLEKLTSTGQPLPPEIFGRLTPRKGGALDLRIGLILVALGLAMAVAGLIQYYAYVGPNPRLFYGVYGAFPAPLFLGGAFLLMAYLRRKDGA